MRDACSRGDEDLLVASGAEPALFVALYDRILPGLLAYFVRRTMDAQVSADLAAETLAEAYASRHRFHDHGPGSATAWLYRIAARKLSPRRSRQDVRRHRHVRAGGKHL